MVRPTPARDRKSPKIIVAAKDSMEISTDRIRAPNLK
jgi:hypothetical protein